MWMRRILVLSAAVAILALSGPAWAQETAGGNGPTKTAETETASAPSETPDPGENAPSPADADLPLDEILDRVEKRYKGTGFTAQFDQISTIAAMDITDRAFGSLWVAPPGKMRWEYEAPDKQVIITDGETLWVYRPQDNQVMTGEAPAYLGKGKGAAFLSDIRRIREDFRVTKEETEDPDYFLLKLVPKDKAFDITAIYLYISRYTFDVVKVVTYNTYDDETLIVLGNYRFDQQPDEALFTFEAPEGVDVLKLDQEE